MSKKNYSNYINGVKELRETIRRIISERVYGLLNESLYEKDDDNNWDKEEEDDTSSKKTSQRAKEWKPQVVSALKDPKINQAAIAYAVHPDMSKDAARSFFSKQVRGKRPFEGDDIITARQKLSNLMPSANESTRMLSKKELKKLFEKISKFS